MSPCGLVVPKKNKLMLKLTFAYLIFVVQSNFSKLFLVFPLDFNSVIKYIYFSANTPFISNLVFSV